MAESADVGDLASRLLSSAPAQWPELIREVRGEDLSAAVSRLGRVRAPAAAGALAAIDALASDRSVRKAARRELHRLRTAGIEPPSVDLAEAAPPPPARPEVGNVQVWATAFDGSGGRALWVLGDRRLGGAWLAGIVMEDRRGLRDVELMDTTRKRVLKDLEARRRAGDLTWVELPADYGLALVKESVELARSRGEPLPRQYPRLRELFGEAERGPERALVYETVMPVDVRFHPEWLEASEELIREPELSGWALEPTLELRARALEVARAGTSQLVVPGSSPEEQMRALMADAGRALLTFEMRMALRRRLEETGQIFAATDRLAQARLAVAAAQALADETARFDTQPLAHALILAGFIRVLGDQEVGRTPAAMVLLQLDGYLRAAGEPEDQPLPGSGLILPR